MVGNMESRTRKPLGVSASMAALVTAYAGLFAAAVLSSAHILKLPVPCGASSGCDTVTQHPGSIISGIPIAYIGLFAYVIIIVLLACASHMHYAPAWLAIITGIGAISSVALLIYAHFAIHALCRWCAVSGAAMVILFGLCLYALRRERAPEAIPSGAIWWLTTATVLALGAEISVSERSLSASPIPPMKLASVPTADLLDTQNVRGPSEAPVKIVMFSDLWCSVCRAIHQPLVDYQAAHPRKVQLIFRHRPLSWVKGHESSEMAAALSEMAAGQGKFWPFVEKLYSFSRPIDWAEYMRVFNELSLPTARAEDYLERADRKWMPSQLERDVALADRLNIRLTPTFVVIVDHHAPEAVNHRRLFEILNSDEVKAMVSPW